MVEAFSYVASFLSLRLPLVESVLSLVSGNGENTARTHEKKKGNKSSLAIADGDVWGLMGRMLMRVILQGSVCFSGCLEVPILSCAIT